MEFDRFGNLTPYEVLPIDQEEFRNVFLDGFEHSHTRLLIYEAYKQYTNALQSLIGSGFTQWIDGSFTTTKLNPQDIDLVKFIDFSHYEIHGRQLNQLRLFFSKLVDAYYAPLYPLNHRLRVLTDTDKIRWLHTFGLDSIRRNKGIIELVYEAL